MPNTENIAEPDIDEQYAAYEDDDWGDEAASDWDDPDDDYPDDQGIPDDVNIPSRDEQPEDNPYGWPDLARDFDDGRIHEALGPYVEAKLDEHGVSARSKAAVEQPRPTPREQLAALMQDAFHSEEELIDLPVELRSATRKASEYVCAALHGNLDEDISPTDAWGLAEEFLDRLKQAEAQKDVRGGKNARQAVAPVLSFSLTRAKISEDNASDYMQAVDTYMGTGNFIAVDTGDIILKHHQTLNEIAESNPSIREEYNKFLTDPDIIIKLPNINIDSQGNFDPDLNDEAFILYTEVLTQLGFDRPEETVSSWKFIADQSIKIIAELEMHEKGAAALLHNFYGIRKFDRYGIEQLKRQYDEHENIESDYGVVISAVLDWNNGFAFQWRDTAAFRTLKTPTRIIEAASAEEFEDRFRLMRERFGAGKMEFAYIHAHGQSGNFDLGHSDINKDTDITYMREVVNERPTIILASCSTGQEQGIAQHFSRELGAVVIGPPRPAGVADVVIVRTDSNLKIEPLFATADDDSLGKYMPVEPMLYVNGERISPDDERYKEYFKELTALVA